MSAKETPNTCSRDTGLTAAADFDLQSFAQFGVHPAPLAAHELANSVAKLRTCIINELGHDAAARLVLPDNFVTYLKLAGAAEHTTPLLTLLSLDAMVHSTASWLSLSRGVYEDEQPADGPWIHVASYGDKHWLFLCCDSGHPEFGNVAEGYDLIPWMDQEELMFNLRATLIDPWGDESPESARWTFADLLALHFARAEQL